MEIKMPQSEELWISENMIYPHKFSPQYFKITIWVNRRNINFPENQDDLSAAEFG